MGYAKIGYWLPIAVDIESKEPFQGLLEIQVPDSDGLMTSSFREAFAVPGQRNTVQHHVKIGTIDADITVYLRDQAGRVVARRRLDLDTDQSIHTVNVTQRLVVYLGSPAGLFEAATDDKRVEIEAQQSVAMRITNELPRQWFDYGSVDELMIATGDPSLLEQLEPAHQSAIQTWVRQGGKLTVSVGRNFQLVNDSFLAEMLPAKVTGVTRVRQPDALETFSKSKNRFNVGGQGLEVATLEEIDGQVRVRQGERPLVVQGNYGLGVVRLIAFDVDEPPFSNWQDRVEFWIELLQFERLTSSTEDAQNLARMRYSGMTDLATLLSTHLENFPEVTVVPFGWVALLIFGYILLIGPIDYLFLKKVVGRLELTWITFPTWVIVISVAAYYAAHWLKGDDLRLNRVEIVDVDQESQTLRGTSFVSIFSPRIDKYSVTVTPSLASAGNWDELGIGTDQSPRTCSWMGIPESALRGMYNQGSVGLFGKRGYHFAGHNPEAVVDVPIQVWSVKSLTGQWLGKAKPVFEAKLVGRDLALTGTLKNLLPHPLHDAVIVYREQAYQIPRIEPNETVDLAAVRSRSLSDYLGDRKIEQLSEFQLQQGQTLHADNFEGMIRSLLFAAKTPKDYRIYPSDYLRHLDFSDRLELGKAIVFARVDLPGGELWFNELPDPQTEKPAPDIGGVVQTQSYIRVLLDTSKDNP